MMLLCGQSNRVWHYLAGRYPGSVGLLLGPSYFHKTPIDPWMPFALDNDEFSAWRDGKPWDVGGWSEMLATVRVSHKTPRWVLVPDAVGDREKTLENWERYSNAASVLKAPLAFAVQDGMTPDDVPSNADVVFVGGTDGWKFPNLPMWTSHFQRVHCARVNAIEMFEACERLGCESIDGTGWFRDTARFPRIQRFIEGHRNQTPELITYGTRTTARIPFLTQGPVPRAVHQLLGPGRGLHGH